MVYIPDDIISLIKSFCIFCSECKEVKTLEDIAYIVMVMNSTKQFYCKKCEK